MLRIGVVGGGSWGDALAFVFSKKMHIVQYSRSSNKLPINDNVSVTNDFSRLNDMDVILLVVPAQELKNVCAQLKGNLKEGAKIIICSKGIEIETGKLPSEIVSQIFPLESIAVLSGPNFAAEIKSGFQAVSSIAAYDLDMANKLALQLKVENFKLIPTDEIYAIQFFGALKNVLAMLCGFARGLSFCENEIAAIITQGVKEITDLASEKSAKKITIANPGCIGDIILTCTSSTSRNTKCGMDLAKNYIDKTQRDDNIMQKNGTVEGWFTALALERFDLSKSPLLEFACRLVKNKMTDKDSVTEEFRRVLFN